MNKAGKKILSTALAAALAVGGLLAGAPPGNLTAYAALPQGAEGQPYDGIDFDALADNGVYYGTYKHVLDNSNNYEPSPTPILWRVMGEEGTSGNVTLLSEYVLDKHNFDHYYNSNWDSSAINPWLNSAFLTNFTPMEEGCIKTPGVMSTVVFSADTVTQNTPVKIFLPAAVHHSRWEDVSWYAEIDTSTTAYIGVDITAKYKGGSSPAEYWLRSDYSNFPLYVAPAGDVQADSIASSVRGVRPVFQFNPSSVLFTSKILPDATGKPWATQADGSNYFTGAAGLENYKLTILNNGVGTLAGVPATQQTASTAGLTLDGLTASQTGTDYTVNYKIVAAGTPRAIVGYGFAGAADGELTIDTSGLNAGTTYDAYVWLQKNNAIHSHEGTNPTHFKLAIDNTDYTVTVNSGSGDGTYKAGQRVTVTAGQPPADHHFKEWTSGDVAVKNPASTTTTFIMPANNVELTATYEHDPLSPDVNVSPLTLDVGETADFQVSFGKGAAAAESAVISSEDATVATALPLGLSDSGSVAVTGVGGGDTRIKVTLGFSNSPAQDYFVPVTVNEDTLPPTTHTVTFMSDGAAYHTATANDGQPVANWPADPAKSGHTFGGWFTGQNGGGTRYTGATPITASVTLYAKWTRNPGGYTPSPSGGSDSGGSSKVDVYTAAASTYIIDGPEMRGLIAAADKNGWDFVRASSDLPATVKAEAWKLLGARKFVARTVADNAVQVQLTFPEPAKLATDIQVSGYVKGVAVDSRRAFFEKWFANKLRVIHLEHSGSFGQTVEAAAKVDLTGMDTKNLAFYSYDKASNSYKRIEKPAHWIDSNGYLHFTTELAGDIIISEGALQRKA